MGEIEIFTGIVEEVGSVKAIQRGHKSARLTISAKTILKDVHTGDSISVNGVCLTVVDFNESFFATDVGPETMRRTNLGTLRAGERVNLERALKAGDRLGGHNVTGHIDGTGKVLSVTKESISINMVFGVEENLARYIVEKGSVAVDGISLTVAHCAPGNFGVSLIPHTLEVTNINDRKAGDEVNIECDITGKYVEKFLRPYIDEKFGDGRIGEEFLRHHGFV